MPLFLKKSAQPSLYMKFTGTYILWRTCILLPVLVNMYGISIFLRASRIIGLRPLSIKRVPLHMTDHDQESDGSLRAKRRVALVAGYVGTDYIGLQMDPNNNLRTIESEIRNALLKTNYISLSNSVNLGKIYWSRSSRTDKRVHASRIIFSGKLEVPIAFLPVKIDSDSQFIRLDSIAEDINKHLPADIRMFGCIKVNQGFSARTITEWRSYEYIIPAKLLENGSKSSGDKAALLEKLNFFLTKMEGCHSFHNFHRLNSKGLQASRSKSKEISRMKFGRHNDKSLHNNNSDSDSGISNEGAAKEDQAANELNKVENEAEVLVGIDEDDDLAEGSTDEDEDSYSLREPINYNTNWTEQPRAMNSKLKGAMYKVHANFLDADESSNDSEWIKISVVGKSFLLQ